MDGGPRTYFEFLQTVQKQGKYGRSFAYKTINTNVLGWLITQVTGKPFTEALSEKVWLKIEAELDAYMSVRVFAKPQFPYRCLESKFEPTLSFCCSSFLCFPLPPLPPLRLIL